MIWMPIALFDACVLVLVEKWARRAARKEARYLRRESRRAGRDTYRIAAPRIPNEKFLWRKLFDHNPAFVVASDKIASKLWIKEQGIAVRTPRTLWVGTDAREITDALWQRPMFIKAAHGWRMNIEAIPGQTDRHAVIEQANAFLTMDHGRQFMEWAYDHVPRRLLAEERVFPNQQMIDIKFYTFGSCVERFVISRYGSQVTSGRWLRQPDDSYQLDDKPTSISPDIDRLPLPPVIDEGLAIARKIGVHFDHIRVDTMTDGEELILGELTVYTQAGRLSVEAFVPETPMNRSWDLRKSWFLTTPQKGWRAIYASALRRTIDRRERAGHGLA